MRTVIGMVIKPPEQVPSLSSTDAQDIVDYVGLKGEGINCEELAYDLTCAHQKYISSTWLRDIPTPVQERKKYQAISNKALALLRELNVDPCEGYTGSITGDNFLDQSFFNTEYLQNILNEKHGGDTGKLSLDGVIEGLVSLYKISLINMAAVENKFNKKTLVGHTPREIFLGKVLPEIYETYFKKWGISRGIKETPSGPAIRFVTKSAEKMGITVSEEAAASARRNYLKKCA